MVSFPPPTEMLHFGGFPLPAGSAATQRGGRIPIRASPDLRLLAPTRGLSQLATPFLGARAEPSTRRLGMSGLRQTYTSLRTMHGGHRKHVKACSALRLAKPGFGGCILNVKTRFNVQTLLFRPALEGSACVGGDPAAPSGTATLLRLLPPRRAQVRRGQLDRASPRLDSVGATGGVCKGQGRIHRAMMTRDY